ncbi:MAG: type I restriction-modification system subunit M [Nitrosomonas sp.]|uniref:type I restriction-modification system subunit M n=1 Tax=Nitrosomonas sp. TaxID=42353 RepID=UPI0025E2796F|nr:class I SAM-dependent DNA methyltransferase [Nitrosomonas sp.]MBY0474948.1 type I restriction-modification system subunit M [Nitrosomonas sp.]
MITGAIKNQVDQIWNTFWSGGVSNPLSVIEQITYLLFAKRLDELHTAKESQANLLGETLDNPIFEPQQSELRWSYFKDFDPERKFTVFRDQVFPFIKSLNGRAGSAYTRFMKDAVFIIPTPALLDKVTNMIDAIPMHDRDTKGDLYEYMLSKIASAGQNGQFRTPRHIIKLMVELTTPTPKDIICDPACGTCGYLVAAAEYLERHHKSLFFDAALKEHFHHHMFHGADFDSSMLRIGAMNMTLHGIDNPSIENRDSLSEDHALQRNAYTLILANPPFKGSLDFDGTAKDLLQVCKTKKTELLFISLFLKQLKPGGRCACIVPDGVLFGSSNAHQQLRRTLVEEQKLDAIISMPSGVFKPYAGVSTAILIFTRTDSGGTDKVFFYDMQADGYSLDDKREPLLTPEQQLELTRHSRESGNPALHIRNNIPDIIARYEQWQTTRQGFEDKKQQAFVVSKADIAANKYDLSINRYRELEYEAVEYDAPQVILDQLEALEVEILADLRALRGML